MKFLLPELFYPNRLDENFNEEEHLKEIKIAQEKYNNYFEESKSMIDKRLLKLYEKTDRFHDYNFHKIIFHANKFFSCKDKDDIIELRLFLKDGENITLYLKNIIKFSMNMNQLNYKEQEREGLEDIVLCEIGYESNCNFINLYMISGTEISIYFKTAEYKITSLKS